MPIGLVTQSDILSLFGNWSSGSATNPVPMAHPNAAAQEWP
jgi:hypothetical protein